MKVIMYSELVGALLSLGFDCLIEIMLFLSNILLLVSVVTFRCESISFFNRTRRIILHYLDIIGLISLIVSLIQRGIYTIPPLFIVFYLYIL
jgi:hypothetical protein